MKKGLGIIGCILLLYSPLPAQVFDFYEMQEDGIGGVDGLNGAQGVVVSPDGKHVYSASSVDDAVSVFSKAGVGTLTYIETHLDDNQPGGTIDGLDGANRLAISPDGKHLYVPAGTDDAVVVFSRNSSTGALTYVETQKDGISGVDGLLGAFEACVSPDNQHVYVTGQSDDMIAVFSRNTSTGALTFVEVQTDGVSGVDGLNGARGIAVAPDGNHVYATASIDDAVSVFSRNSSTGALTYVEMQKNGVGGVDGLNAAYGVCVSADNNHVYVASLTDDALVGFSRNTGTGALTYLEVHKDDTQTGGTLSYLNGARHVAISNDGNYVAVAASTDDALTLFARTPASGLLVFEEDFQDGLGSVDGLNGVRMVVFGTDDYNLFAAGSSDDAVAVFTENTILAPSLHSFSLTVKTSQMVELSWTSQKEEDGTFLILRSPDAQNWHQLQANIHKVWKEDSLEHKAVDDDPLEGLSYYRLLRTDLDGKQQDSRIVSAMFGDVSRVIIHPNPTKDFLFVQFGTRMEWGMLEVCNPLGKRFLSQTIQDQETATVPLEFLPSGLYFLRVNLIENQTVFPFLKQ